MKKQIVIIFFTLLSLLSCQMDVSDLTVGNNGLITITEKSIDSVTLNWTAASASSDSISELEYLAFYSTTELDVTVEAVILNATSFSQYTANINSVTITGLEDNTLYYFYVIVREGLAKKAIYQSVSETTDKIPTEPTEPLEPYYSAAEGKTGYELKTALHNIISSGTTVISYDGLWDMYAETDDKYGNNTIIWDIYSDIPDPLNPNVPDGTQPNEYELTYSVHQDSGSGGSVEGQFYNREHTMPKSWFNDAYPMYSDAFHVLPTDKKVNNTRSNYPYGEVANPTWESINGSKLGNNSTTGYSGTVFEPADTYKGDVARIYFYMATRYENVIDTWEKNSDNSDATFDGSSDKVYEDWLLEILIKWNKEDPVSQKEIDRNESVYALQKNRNPFVDHPEWVENIW